ncbi:hypothetical protein [Candidatus Nitrosoglobus terrae]
MAGFPLPKLLRRGRLTPRRRFSWPCQGAYPCPDRSQWREV